MSRPVMTASGAAVFVCDTPSISSVAASITSVVLAPANTNRIHGSVFNDSSATLYLSWGSVSSTAAYTVQVPPKGFYELPRVNQYVGAISGVWSAANGAALITEAT